MKIKTRRDLYKEVEKLQKEYKKAISKGKKLVLLKLLIKAKQLQRLEKKIK